MVQCETEAHGGTPIYFGYRTASMLKISREYKSAYSQLIRHQNTATTTTILTVGFLVSRTRAWTAEL